MESPKIKRTSLRKTSLKRSKKNSILSKSWKLIRMPPKIRSKRLTESWPLSIILKTIHLQRQEPNSHNWAKLTKKRLWPKIKQSTQTLDSGVSSRTLTSKCSSSLDWQRRARRKRSWEVRASRQTEVKIRGDNFTHNRHTCRT
jgi:hypothetical protein